MNIISCDVGWQRETKRNAVATNSGQVNFLKSGLYDGHLVALVMEWAAPQSLTLLDVAIDGCEKLERGRRTMTYYRERPSTLYSHVLCF